jgi:hypothetical protein
MRGDGIRKEGRKCKQGGKAFMPRGFKDKRGEDVKIRSWEKAQKKGNRYFMRGNR